MLEIVIKNLFLFLLYLDIVLFPEISKFIFQLKTNSK